VSVVGAHYFPHFPAIHFLLGQPANSSDPKWPTTDEEYFAEYLHSIEHSAFAQKESSIPIDPKSLPKISGAKSIFIFHVLLLFLLLFLFILLSRPHANSQEGHGHGMWDTQHQRHLLRSHLLRFFSRFSLERLRFFSCHGPDIKSPWNAALNSNLKKQVAHRIAARALSFSLSRLPRLRR